MARMDVRAKRGGGILVSLFAPQETADGFHAPSLCAHKDIRAGTVGLYGKHKLRLPSLKAGMSRPVDGFYFEKVR